MSTNNPVDCLFGGMGKLGPGSNADTLQVLCQLPKQNFPVIVDAGCGTGRQTLMLARALRSTIHAIDIHEPFLNELEGRAREARLDHLVQIHLMDMKDIPQVFPGIDLLWSEGAAYNIGFANALSAWAPAIRPRGFAVVSELVWLSDSAPRKVRDFYAKNYPDMQSIPTIIARAENAGFELLNTHALPAQAWIQDYYNILEPRAKALVGHSNVAVRDFAVETIREIEIFRAAEGSFGYVFFILRRR